MASRKVVQEKQRKEVLARFLRRLRDDKTLSLPLEKSNQLQFNLK